MRTWQLIEYFGGGLGGSRFEVFRSRLKAAGNWILWRDWKSLAWANKKKYEEVKSDVVRLDCH